MAEGEPKVVSLMPWDIAVRNATQRKSARALLERDDADEIIRGMSELEVYYALRALGVEDAIPFLTVIEAEQITTLFDLEVWHAGRPSVSDFLAWLDGFREAGLAQLQNAIRVLDIELVAAALRERLFIAIKPTDDDAEHEAPDWLRNLPDECLPIMETPDRVFLLAARVEDEATGEGFDEEERKSILRLIEDLYRDEDFAHVSRLLHVAATDLSSELEEHSLRFRNARLEDLGFPTRERALEVYGPIDVASVLGRAEPARHPVELKLPAVLIEPYARGFFEEVLETVENPELIRTLESELVALSNHALVADGIEPGNLEGIREVLERARGYLELALRHGAGTSEAQRVARQRLETHSVRTLFRVGYSLVLSLGGRARALQTRRDLGPAQRFLDEADQGLIRALLRPRALYLPPGADLDQMEPFRHPEQVESVRVRLEEIDALAELSASVGFTEAHAAAETGLLPPPEEWSFEHLLATLLAKVALGEAPPAFSPLSAAEIEALGSRLADFDPLQTAFERAYGACGTRLRRRLRAAHTRLLEVTRGPIDLRFLDPLIRRT